MHLHRVLLAAAMVALLGAAPATASAQEAGPSLSMVEADLTNITTWGFAPTVAVGQAVTWTNVGAQPHTVTVEGTAWDTGIIAPGAAATLAFDAPGTYTYLCTLHPTMLGSIIVSDVAPPEVPAPAMAIVEPDLALVPTWTYAVSIPVGQSVTWTNGGSMPHTVTAADLSFDTSFINPGESRTLPFATPGLFTYVCAPHPWMRAAVLVS